MTTRKDTMPRRSGATRKKAFDVISQRHEIDLSEILFRSLFEQLPIGAGLATLDGHILLCNNTIVQMLGYSEDELKRINVSDLYLNPQERKLLIKQYQAEGCIKKYETAMKCKDGASLQVELTIIPFPQFGRDVVFTALNDIRKRKQFEDQLLEREIYYRSLLHTIKDDIIVINRDYIVTDINNSFLNTTGYQREDVTGHHCYEISHGYNEPCRHLGKSCTLPKVFFTGMPDKCQHEHSHLDGTKVYVDILLSPLKDNDGNVTHIIESIRDITDLYKIQNALLNSEKELSIRNNIANIFLTVPDDEMYGEVLQAVLEATESIYGVFGYINEEETLIVPSMTRHVWDKCNIIDKDNVFPQEAWGCSSWPRAIREKRTIYSNEPSTNISQGHIGILRHVSLPVIHQGEVIGLIQIANKITDYTPKDIQLLETIGSNIAPVLAARLQRERLHIDLADYAARLERFLYTASHDLKSPLITIKGFIGMLEQDLVKV
ncbi:MAG: PAS domain S-box protein [Sedimentisphaerales bacterium]|nr:PAS domain S-box protein [Sedimentisphaerales bacterium]